tara:strand:+ start:2999 stop:3655 length:657 start_codon:yes stop_codon:yes gene_type:complete
MEHLSSEKLAYLVDERPSPSERAHLKSCTRCSEELNELRIQSHNLLELAALRPSPDNWESLETRLVNEGLIRNKQERFRRFGITALPIWIQATAAILLFLGGAGFGLNIGKDETSNALSLDKIIASTPEIETADEAARAVVLAEQAYMQALLHFRQFSDKDDENQMDDPLNRVEALEGLLVASQEALRLAPTDPLFNGLLINVLSQRQEMLKQISESR